MADKFKFTPGPWFFDGPPDNHIVWSSGENRICFMAHSNGIDPARDTATARLIAEAPDMYDALDVTAVDLDLLRRAIEDGDPKAELLIRVKDMQERHRRALSKAEGRDGES